MTMIECPKEAINAFSKLQNIYEYTKNNSDKQRNILWTDEKLDIYILETCEFMYSSY